MVVLQVHGILRGSKQTGVVVIKRRALVSQHADGTPAAVWEQRSASDVTSHLNRDYVCGERAEDIVNEWLPCDWAKFTVHVASETDDVDSGVGGANAIRAATGVGA